MTTFYHIFRSGICTFSMHKKMGQSLSILFFVGGLLVNNAWSQTDSTNVNIGIQNPSNVTEEVQFDAENNQYIILQKVGDIILSTNYYSAEEYRRKMLQQSALDYWREKEKNRAGGRDVNSLIPPINVKNEIFKGIFGSNKIEIRPQGTAELILGVRVNKTDNPNIPLQQRTVTTFNFDQNIQLNVLGKIGDKIQLNANFNTKALFNFENQMNLKYEGGEDDILQLLEFGNVNLPLTGTLIQGSQALFGIKNKLKFGKLEITTVFSQQQGQKQTVTVEGGAQITKFEVSCAGYEANRHYFVGDYFMNLYDDANKTLPYVTSPVYLTRVEVWVTNRINATENVRNIVGILPLGELLPNTNIFPANANNFNPQDLPSSIRDITSQALYNQLQNGLEIEKLANARLLKPNEYSFDPLLGYISLNQSLNADEVLAVAYQYTAGGQTFQVGEFSTDIEAPNALVVKLLKASNFDISKPNWPWMMKNIYSIGGYNIGSDDFILNILYQDTESGVKLNYFPTVPGLSGLPLLRLFNLDRLNQQNDLVPDGFFDFVDGRTIKAQNGRIIFPVREPYSRRYLKQVFTEANPSMNVDLYVERYAFDTLYKVQQQMAELNQEKNRFYMAGSYKGAAGNEISLNAFNVPQGSVTVTAGGQTLTENVDYTVDYAAGRVRIINESILNSGLPINISLENNATFNIQQKRLFGTHIDYKFSKNFQIGATLMNLSERPLTQKIDVGQEPVNNTIWGFDVNYSTQSNFITRMIDKIPGINTRAPSQIILNGEFAHIIPGYNGVIDQNGENGVSYVDDFEGAETPIDIRNPFMWKLGSVPEGGNPRFPNAELFDNLGYNFNRARLSWFTMDPLFYRFNSLTPQTIKNNPSVMVNNYLREVQVTEVFPGYQPPLQQGIQPQQLVLDLNFYPDERGPYNFDVDNFDETVTDKLVLKNPEQNFGSMMRRVETTDWDAANVSYIEFWMMDPFDNTDLNQLKEWEDGTGAINKNTLPGGGGDFILQIGNMNEDILKDGRMSFENGMPTPTDPNRPLVTTAWGRIPALQPINQNFDNDPATRELQDVGYDGLSDTAEQNFFNPFLSQVASKYGIGNAVYDSIFADPAADNFTHYNSDIFNQSSTLIPGFNYPHNRYKKFLGPEKNSPASNINFSYGQVPNTEDANNNFTLDKPEGYYQYVVSLRPDDLNTIGKNFITDILNTTIAVNVNGQVQNKQVKWIQFRVPIRTEDKEQFGNINDFRSIRFMRMLLQGFPDDIYVRLATMQLVRADWRTYTNDIWDPDAFVTVNSASFNSTTVNIEENTRKKPFPYALPPGISREIDPANPQLQQLNEQALVLNVCDLQDGEAKSVFKNTSYDMRAYKYLKMFAHAEHVLNNTLDSNDISLFVRLGMDASENYYEIEIPLKPTDPNTPPPNDPNPNDQIPNDDPVYKRALWPQENELNIDLQLLPEIKLERNTLNLPSNVPYEKMVDGKRIRVVGNPNIANVRTVMIGVRNPHQKHNPWQTGTDGGKVDDGLAKCAQVWVNEMRLTDYFESGGWAAKARAQINLADFGQVAAAVSYTTFGFGSIDQKPLQRSRNNTTTFDFTSSFEFGKFFGAKAGVTIPIFFGYSTKLEDPQFNPLDPDIYFRDALAALQTDEERDALRQMTQTLLTKTNFNITNMRKNRTNNKRKPKIWDIENWDASYSYTNETFRDTRTEYNNTFEHRGSLGYTFTPQAQSWEPFKKSKKLKSKWAKWIKDFNFSWSPKRVAFRANIQRDVNEFKLRNTTEYPLLILPTYRKNFTWVRTYEFQYNPFKSISLTFSATNQSRIDEPEIPLDESVKPKVPFFGRNTSYQHNWDAAYTLPFSKLPLTDWITASIGYGGNFRWIAGNMEVNPGGDFTMGRWGNTAQNANTIKGNVQLNMTTLYNKIPWIKDLGKPQAQKKTNKQGANDNKPKNPNEEDDEKKKPKIKIVTWEKIGVTFKAGKKKLIKHELKTENITIKVIAPDGREIKGKTEVIDKKRARFIAEEDVKDATIKIEGKIERKPFRWMVIPETLARIVTGVKNISVSYNESNGTTIPGYKAGTTLLGMDFYNPSFGPDFVFGRQFSDVDLVNKSVQNAWLIRDSTLNVLFMRTHSSNLTANATYEPFKGFRITLTANRTYVENFQSNYRYIPTVGDFVAQNPLTMGNFSMSYMTIGTAFGGEGTNFTSRWFNDMLQARSIISNRMALLNPNANPIAGATYQSGYGETQQDVMMYSFLAAYTGKDPNTIGLEPFPAIPIPNWRLQFDGLNQIKSIKKIFKNIVLTHAYQSTYSVAGYQSNYVYNDKNPQDWINNPFDQSIRDDNNNFVSQYFLNSISLVESFNPLIKLDMSFHNSITANVEIKSSRNIALNFPNQQITENNTFEVIVGAGYIIKEVKLPFRIGGKQIKSNLNLRFDFGLRDNSTIIRKISPTVEQVTAGQRAITIKGFAEYMINTSLSVRLFVDQIINNPFVANQFPTANTNAGLSIRFTLTQ